MVWKTPHDKPQRISPTSSIGRFCAKKVMKMKQIMPHWRKTLVSVIMLEHRSFGTYKRSSDGFLIAISVLTDTCEEQADNLADERAVTESTAPWRRDYIIGRDRSRRIWVSYVAKLPVKRVEAVKVGKKHNVVALHDDRLGRVSRKKRLDSGSIVTDCGQDQGPADTFLI